MHDCDTQTVSAVKALHRHYGGWRKVAEALGFPRHYATTLSKVSRGEAGALSLEGENELRYRMGLDPRGSVSVPSCPDCGRTHVGRCHGKATNGQPVQVVVIWPDEEKISKKRKRKSKPDTRHRLTVSPENKAALDELGLSADEAITQFLERQKGDA